MWLADCRIPFGDTEDIDFTSKQSGKIYCGNSLNESVTERNNTTHYTTQGRFTPNLLVCDDMLNNVANSPDNYGDKGTNSRNYDLDKWFDKMVDEL
jgi:hypothetical protein